MKAVKRFGTLLLTFALALALAVPAFATVKDAGYSDVDAGASYAEAVIYCREHGLMSGTDAKLGFFEPEGPLTRAQLATVLYRLEGEPSVTGEDSFIDTASDAWYSSAILWASQREVMGGYGGGIFGTNDPVTRQDMATILYRYAGSPEVDSMDSYDDEDDIADYATVAVDWASANGIVSALSGNTFAPRNSAVRAQIAVALMNYVRNVRIESTSEPAPSSNPKVLIVYFSATNNTKNIANHLDAILDADLYEITPAVPYTSADLNYGDSSSRTTIEQSDPSARPTISGSVANMKQYDVVFVGYPIWWGQAPKIISTFLESYNFNGKTIIPFCTSGSSGIGSSAAHLHSLTSGATWLDGQRFSGSAARSAVNDWVNGLGLTLTLAA